MFNIYVHHMQIYIYYLQEACDSNDELHSSQDFTYVDSRQQFNELEWNIKTKPHKSASIKVCERVWNR